MNLAHASAARGSSIVTLTMNPALDVTTNTTVVAPGDNTHEMGCGAARHDPGGGGINVARIARVLGASATAVFPAGGPIGDLLTELVAQAGVGVRRVPIAGSTRQSVTVDETSTGRQYRFVLPGPPLTFAEQCECLNQLRAAVAGARFVVASGSLPPNVHPDYYQRVADICEEHGARLVLDTSGGGLRHVTDGVYLLKPSVRELRECVGRELQTEADQLAAAHQLIDRGCAHNVVVSLGSKGALLATPDGSQRYWSVTVPSGSGVAAGDAMVAAITVGLIQGWSVDKSIRLGIAAGAAMLMTPGSAPCALDDVQRLFDEVPEAVRLKLDNA